MGRRAHRNAIFRALCGLEFEDPAWSLKTLCSKRHEIIDEIGLILRGEGDAKTFHVKGDDVGKTAHAGATARNVSHLQIFRT